jgi:tripartite-type tricarboxylate transporter receptor subunit TctC
MVTKGTGMTTVVSRRRTLLVGLSAASLSRAILADDAAVAARAVRLVVPFPAGGGADMLGRTLEPTLSRTMKQRVIIENVPGAGGVVGSAQVARAPADGQLLLLAPSSALGSSVHLVPGLPYRPEKDFTPLALVVDSPIVVLCRTALSVFDLDGLLRWARSTNRSVTYATSGSGTPHHIAGEQLRLLTDIPFVHVPYKGASQALTDLLAGHVDLAILGLPGAMAQIAAGRLAAVGITGARRSLLAPDLAPIAASLPAFQPVGAWYGLLAPAGLAPSVQQRLEGAIVGALADEPLRSRLAALGFDVLGQPGSELARAIRDEVRLSGEVIRRAGIRSESR